MNDNYEDLVRRATKGDEDATSALFALGEQRASGNGIGDASAAFRDSAVAYRIAAFRNKARAEDAERRAKWAADVCDMYRQWIEQNPKGMRDAPRKVDGIDSERIRQVLIDELLDEEPFYVVVAFMGEVLKDMGVEFYSPGGSVPRRVWNLLDEHFGVTRSWRSRYLENLDIRVGLDLLGDEIVRRCQARGPDGPQDEPSPNKNEPRLRIVKT